MAFFTTWKVARYVKPNFSGSNLGLSHDTAFQISHWVPGKSEVLLMEPVIAARDDFREEIGRVSTSFLAWRQLLDNRKEASRNRPDPRFIAYVINGRQGEASTVRSVLKEARADVIDVEIPTERDRFIHQIRVVGESREELKNQDQEEFPL
ncbi:hypothetical protein [Corallococcus exiguus]|uniref:hypothetical protein n=1 Tax=Corallococcus exiguus TaxID=83462 RepID=UPI001560EEDB|nr:hypothetical protein [Corallococcus exiguus]NRD45967.1 hypothetical protein [Corallococcus exiguus]